jgi:hypothetical protein
MVERRDALRGHWPRSTGVGSPINGLLAAEALAALGRSDAVARWPKRVPVPEEGREG